MKKETRLSLRTGLRVLTRSLRLVPHQEGTNHSDGNSSASGKRVGKLPNAKSNSDSQRLEDIGRGKLVVQPGDQTRSISSHRPRRICKCRPITRACSCNQRHCGRVLDRGPSTHHDGPERGSLMTVSLNGSRGGRGVPVASTLTPHRPLYDPAGPAGKMKFRIFAVAKRTGRHLPGDGLQHLASGARRPQRKSNRHPGNQKCQDRSQAPGFSGRAGRDRVSY
jgi:hypothetical protein